MAFFNLKSCIGCLGMLFVLASCSDKSVDPYDDIVGAYHLEGYQVNLEICYVSQNCQPGEVLSRDTVQISFTVEIVLVNHRNDTLLFRNLEGADTGINHPNYSGHAADETCPFDSHPRYCAYASFQDDSLKFDIRNQPGSYSGTGLLKNDELSLQTHFRHRAAGVDYILSGTKQEN